MLLRLAAGWREQGRQVTLVIGSTAGPLAREIPEGVTVRELGTGSYAALARAMPSIVRATAPDLIFCPGNHYTAVAGYARLRLGRKCPPIVGKISNALVRIDMGKLTRSAYRQWLALHPYFLDRVVAMSRATAIEAAREMRLDMSRIQVIANPPASTLADEYPLPPGRFLLGIGRLEPQKRWDRLIAALPRLAAGDVHLMILGEGSLREEIEAQASALGLLGRIMLPGHVSNPMFAALHAEAVVLTSDFEGVPGVLREALAVGTPVIATDSSVSVREIIASPALGSVVAREDGDALVAALDHWLAPGVTRPAPVEFDGNDSIAEYLALFDRVVAQRNP